MIRIHEVQMSNIITQIIMLVLLGLTGYAAGRTRYLSRETGIVLSRVVIRVTAPFMIFTTMTGQRFTSDILRDGAALFIFGFAGISAAFALAWLVSGKMRLQPAARSIYLIDSMFGNVSFLAFPLLFALFGQQGIIYAIFYNLANDMLLWTLGIFLLNRQNDAHWKQNLKQLVNANTIAFTMGLAAILGDFQGKVQQWEGLRNVYSVFYNTFYPLGQTTIYISMVFIGLILSDTHIGGLSGLRKRYPLLVLSLCKLLVMPVLALGVLTAMGNWVPVQVKVIGVLQMAMPCATVIPALAEQYGVDYEFATEAVFFSTILGMISLPIMVWIIQHTI